MANRAEVVKCLRQGVTTIIKDLHKRVLSNLTFMTPKDTTFAVHNWIPSLGTPHSGTAGTRAAAELGTIDAGTQARGLAQVELARDLTKTPVYIVNNVEYIVDLNDGTSRQAPRNFVDRAIEEAIAGRGS